uniref:Cytochrome P450 2W1-like n=1 Tax=Pogona vitticeps TaxID=103695 RepID=A0A6J0UGY9_9SAUR
MAPWLGVLLSLNTTVLLCILLLILMFLALSSPGKSSLRFPPGPRPLPIIGNLHLLDIRRQDLSYMKISEEYGPVFSLFFGSQRVVVVTGYEAVTEALMSKGSEFVDRPVVPVFHHMNHENGLFFSVGDLWKTTRRFTLSSLRELGMGKTRLERRIHEELLFLMEKIRAFKGEAFDLLEFSGAATNVAFTLFFGDRFDYADPIFNIFLRNVHEIIGLLGVPHLQIYNVYPYLGFLFKPHKTILKRSHETFAVLKKFVRMGKQNINENHLESYVDKVVFQQQEEEKHKEKNTFYDDNILSSLLDLVIAGTETTATTIRWAIVLMMKYPDIQKKVQEEIHGVLGTERLPTYEDRKQLPFTEAVIHEIQRFASVVPQFPRSTAVDTHFRGYFIPKGTMVIPSLTSVLYDKTQWETPFQFNPNHFLDDKGNYVKKEAFIPFSIGRRNCPGEAMGRMEVFLFFAGLLQKFTFRPPHGVTEADLDLSYVSAFTRRPQSYSTRAVPCT